jgi:hypothetical protein
MRQCHSNYVESRLTPKAGGATRAGLIASLKSIICTLLVGLLAHPTQASHAKFDWGLGAYVGQYYDSEPAGWTKGKANYLDHYLVAVTASKTLWRSNRLPLSLEIDGMIGQQSGIVSLTEIALIPVLRWSSFPWNRYVQTDLRLGPMGISHTSSVSPLERGPSGKGSQTLSFLIIEMAFSRPSKKSEEFFLRLHHRCAVYDKLNDYGANGEDFFAVGFRHRF